MDYRDDLDSVDDAPIKESEFPPDPSVRAWLAVVFAVVAVMAYALAMESDFHDPNLLIVEQAG